MHDLPIFIGAAIVIIVLLLFLRWERRSDERANLPISLYRYSNIPARYVTGVMEVLIEQAMNWVGVEDAETVVKVLKCAGKNNDDILFTIFISSNTVG